MAQANWIATTSPGDYGTNGNWSTGAVPIATNAVAFENSNIDVGSGNLDQSAIALASFIAYDSYTGKIGVANLSSTPGTAGSYLIIDSALTVIGRCLIPGVRQNGSPRLMLDVGGTTTNKILIESTSMVSADYGLPPVRIKGNKSAHTLTIIKGWAGVACARSDETTTLGTITIGQAGLPNNLTKFVAGPGLTVTAINTYSGINRFAGTVPTLKVFGGYVEHIAAGASTAVTVYGGVYKVKSTGTQTLITINGGLVDTSEAPPGATITNVTNNVGKNALRIGPNVTFTNPPTNNFGDSEGGGGGVGDYG